MAIDLNNGFRDLLEHVGHDVVLVTYGPENNPANVALECQTCGCVLLDFDNDALTPEPHNG